MRILLLCFVVRFTHANLGSTPNKSAPIITTVGADGPCQVDDVITTDTPSAECGMAVWAQNKLVLDATLALWADELLFDVVA
jgi:hypothetical protein